MYHTETRFCPWPSHWAHIIHIPHTHDCYGVTSYIYHTHAHLSPWPSNWAFIIHGPHTHSYKILTPGHHFLGAHHTYTIYTYLSPWPSNWAFTIHGPHTHNYDSLAQLLGLHHSNTTYSQLLSHGPVTGLIWDKCQLYKHWLPGILFCAHIIYIPYTHIFPPGPVTGLSSYMDHIHTHMTPWPSYWAYIVAIPHFHNFYPTAQLLDLYDTYVTYIKHWLLGTIFWADIILIPCTHTFPPGPVTELSSYMDLIHTTKTPWPSYWAYIVAIPHFYNFYPKAQLLDLYETNVSYIKHRLLGTIFWAHIIHIPYTHIFPPGPVTGLSSHMDHIHTNMTPWPSYWAYIVAIPHFHNFYPTAQLLDLYDTYVTYIKHWLPGIIFWAHIIYIPYTHIFPAGPVTGLSSYMDHIHTTMTPWPSYWAYIIAIPHIHNCYPTAQLLDLYDTYVTYIKHWHPGIIFWAHIIHIPYTHIFPPGPVTGLSSYMDHIHATMTPWPSYWAYIIAIPHIHNCYPTAQLLDLYDTYVTYIKHWLPGTIFWAHIIHIPYTHIFPPWPSNWAFIIHGPHTHNYDSLAQLLGLHGLITSYI